MIRYRWQKRCQTQKMCYMPDPMVVPLWLYIVSIFLAFCLGVFFGGAIALDDEP